MIAFTHLIFGLAIGKVLNLRLGTVMIFAVLPDLDRVFIFAYPLVRNGIMHSLFATAVFSLSAYFLFERKSTALSCLGGYKSHLLLDFLCINGLTLLYPIKKFYSLGIMTETSLLGNFTVLSISAILILAEENLNVSRKVKRFS